MGAGTLAIIPQENEPGKNPQNQPCEVSLKWSNMQVKFRVVADFQTSQDEYDLFPSLDATAPSFRSLTLQKRLLKRTQVLQDNTLTGYIGSSSGSNSLDNQSVASKESSKDCKNNANSDRGENKPVKHCPICKKTFSKATYLKRHILSHSSVKPYKCDICNWGM